MKNKGQYIFFFLDYIGELCIISSEKKINSASYHSQAQSNRVLSFLLLAFFKDRQFLVSDKKVAQVIIHNF